MSAPEYLLHITLDTGHARRSLRSEIDPGVLASVRAMLLADRFDMPFGHTCVVVSRSPGCIELEVLAADDRPLLRIGVARADECGALWQRLGGGSMLTPPGPWCAARLHMRAVAEHLESAVWLGDFERCVAWAFVLESGQ
jgi:hypothetical protein